MSDRAELSVVHVLSQEGQPYGSERRCCNHCGIIIWGPSAGPSALPHVDNWTDWHASLNNCGRGVAELGAAELTALLKAVRAWHAATSAVAKAAAHAHLLATARAYAEVCLHGRG